MPDQDPIPAEPNGEVAAIVPAESHLAPPQVAANGADSPFTTWKLTGLPARFTVDEDGVVLLTMPKDKLGAVFHGVIRQLQEQFNATLKAAGKSVSAMTPPARSPRAIPEGQAQAAPPNPAAPPAPTQRANIPMQQPVPVRRNAPAAPSMARRPAGRPPNVDPTGMNGQGGR